MSINTKKPAMKQTVGAQYMCFADATEDNEYNGTYEADVEIGRASCRERVSSPV